MEKYDTSDLQDFLQGQKTAVGLAFTMLSSGAISLLVSMLSGFSLICVSLGRYNWRRGLHAGWVLLSLSFTLLFACSGVILPVSVFLGELCPIVKSMLDTSRIDTLMVLFIQGGAAGQALQTCFLTNSTFDSYINLTQVLTFLVELDALYEEMEGYKYDGNTFQFYTLALMEQEISALNTNTFLSEYSENWDANRDISFFLSLNTSSKITQSRLYAGFYLNDYTDYASGSGQFSHCRRVITNDFWTYKAGNCPEGYVYLPKLLLILSSSAEPNCYALSDNFTKNDLNSRYVNLGMYSDCTDIGSQSYTSSVLDFWTAANTSYSLELSFRSLISQFQSDQVSLQSQFRPYLLQIHDYTQALKAVHPNIDSLVALTPTISLSLQCGSLVDLTLNEYRAVCGELLPNMLMLTLASGGLGVAVILVTLGIVTGFMWFKTDLEMDVEGVLQKIGRKETVEPSKSQEMKPESLFEAASERTILESEASIAIPVKIKPGLEVFQISKPGKRRATEENS